MIRSLTSKTRFFELFIENKNLIKQGLYLLEICQNAAGSTDLVTYLHGHNGPSWTLWPHTCAISSAALFITLNGRYDGWSQAQQSFEGLHSKTLELLEYGYWTTSLNFMTSLQDGPSWVRRSVTLSITPHLVRLPHLPSAAALRYHLQTVMSMTDRHKLRRWSLLHFFAQKPPHSSLDRFPANKEKLI